MTSKQQQWQILLENPSIHVRLSLILALILFRSARDLMQIPKKIESNRPIVCDFWTKIWLKSY